MKHILIFIAIITTIETFSQSNQYSCYNEFRLNGIKEYNNGEYFKAYDNFIAARDACDSVPPKHDIDNWLDSCDIGLQNVRLEAVEAKRNADSLRQIAERKNAKIMPLIEGLLTHPDIHKTLVVKDTTIDQSNRYDFFLNSGIKNLKNKKFDAAYIDFKVADFSLGTEKENYLSSLIEIIETNSTSNLHIDSMQYLDDYRYFRNGGVIFLSKGLLDEAKQFLYVAYLIAKRENQLEYQTWCDTAIVNTQIKTEKINIKNRYLYSLPNELFYLRGVKELNLSNNYIKELPKHIGNFKYLVTLDISDNSLSCLPNEIVNLQKLQSLNIANNDIKEVPVELTKLKSLKSLRLDKNNINSLSNLCELNKIEELSLAQNKIEKIPASIKNITSLKSLDISQNLIHTISCEIGELINLKILNLSWNEIKVIPNEIKNLKNLKELDLSLNNITKVPSELGDLHKLKILNLRNNGKLQTETLYIALKDYPKPVTISTYEYKYYSDEYELLVKLSYNFKFTEELSNIKNLTKLILIDAGINAIPPFIAECKNIERIDLRNNSISALPNEIYQLENLSYLYLDRRNFSFNEQSEIELNLPNCNVRWD